MEWLAAMLGAKWRAPDLSGGRGRGNGEMGGYCRGKDVKECRRLFGERLPEICATCPD